MIPKPGEALGPFTVLRELGRGGMGAVLVVRRPGSEVELALKLVLAADDPVALARFGREAELLARVQHPAVLRVHELGRLPQGPYLLTDLVEGEPLDQLVRRSGPLPPAEAARIARELADGLVALHAAGVLHRDVKPQNVVLRADGRPVLLDFGLARSADGQRLTLTGEILGTPAYMPPEQADGASPETLDGRVDVYALGAMLYFLLGGEPPFRGTTIEVLRKVFEEEPPWPAAPPALLATLRRAMCKEREGRQPDAAALRDELDRASADAVAPRRRWPLFAALGLGAAALALAVGLGLRAQTPPGPAPSASDPRPGPSAGPSASPSRADSGGPSNRRRAHPDDILAQLAKLIRRLQRPQTPAIVFPTKLALHQALIQPLAEQPLQDGLGYRLAGPTCWLDARRLLTAGGVGPLRSWDLDGTARDLNPREAFDTKPEATPVRVTTIARRPGDELLLGVTSEPMVRVRVTARGLERVAQYRLRGVGALAVDPSGTTAAVGCGSQVYLVAIDEPAGEPRELTGHTVGYVGELAFLAGGRQLAVLTGVGEEGNGVCVYTLPAGEVAWRSGDEILLATPNSVALHPGGRYLVVGTGDRRLVVYDLENPRRRPPELTAEVATNSPLQGPTASALPLEALAFSPSGRRLYAVSGEYGGDAGRVPWKGELAVWDTSSFPAGERLWWKELPAAGWSVELSPDGRMFAVGLTQRGAQLYAADPEQIEKLHVGAKRR
ncbi:MAG: WD40 repeat domain-containing serine/threonine protein kinase [Planctomycetota bacterium]